MSNIEPRSREEPIERGKACIRCRRRKIRCDGRRPFCSACVRANKTDDCEYTDSQGRTGTQILEETLDRLQARLQELENPDAVEPILLVQPYRASEGHGAEDLPQSLVPALNNWWELEEPPAQIRDMLMDIFLPYASLLGFSLSTARLKETIALSDSHPLGPHPALVNAIMLWGLRISDIPELSEHEDLYVERAVLSLQDAIGTRETILDPWTIAGHRLQVIQASILLAYYFFVADRPLEGRYHASSAATLALGAGLHRAASDNSQGVQGSIEAQLLLLAPARNPLELGERIRLFWEVYFLDRCWSVALGVPCALIDDAATGTQIDAPWPLELADYEKMNTMADIETSRHTVLQFLSGEASGDSIQSIPSRLALRAKAAALYEYSTRMHSTVQSSADVQIQSLAIVIANFARSLAPLDEMDSSDRHGVHRQCLAVVHGLTHAAMVQLHSISGHETSDGEQHSNEIVMILELILVGHAGLANGMGRMFDPVFSIIAMSVADTLIRKYKRLLQGAQTYASHNQSTFLRRQIDRLAASLRRAAGAQDLYPCFAQQADRIDEMLEV